MSSLPDVDLSTKIAIFAVHPSGLQEGLASQSFGVILLSKPDLDAQLSSSLVGVMSIGRMQSSLPSSSVRPRCPHREFHKLFARELVDLLVDDLVVDIALRSDDLHCDFLLGCSPS